MLIQPLKARVQDSYPYMASRSEYPYDLALIVSAFQACNRERKALPFDAKRSVSSIRDLSTDKVQSLIRCPECPEVCWNTSFTAPFIGSSSLLEALRRLRTSIVSALHSIQAGELSRVLGSLT